jgi:hypothetical protein
MNSQSNDTVPTKLKNSLKPRRPFSNNTNVMSESVAGVSESKPALTYRNSDIVEHVSRYDLKVGSLRSNQSSVGDEKKKPAELEVDHLSSSGDRIDTQLSPRSNGNTEISQGSDSNQVLGLDSPTTSILSVNSSQIDGMSTRSKRAKTESAKKPMLITTASKKKVTTPSST